MTSRSLVLFLLLVVLSGFVSGGVLLGLSTQKTENTNDTLLQESTESKKKMYRTMGISILSVSSVLLLGTGIYVYMSRSKGIDASKAGYPPKAYTRLGMVLNTP